MGLFDRIAFITRSKANALLDDLEDPVQTIEDATKEYAQVKADLANAEVQKVSGESAFSRFRMLVTMCSTSTLTAVVEQPLRS